MAMAAIWLRWRGAAEVAIAIVQNMIQGSKDILIFFIFK
jgi:hypothetical protein